MLNLLKKSSFSKARESGENRPSENESSFRQVEPWPLPRKEDCIFYHSLDLPEGESIEGAWDIRDNFDQYIGNYPISGASVLDIGTASGYIAFSAEKAGAIVTALDARDAREIRHIQFRGGQFHENRAEWYGEYDTFLRKLKNSFWYAWHRLGSSVKVFYVPLDIIPLWKSRWDVVVAGAILEHLSDPVTVLGNIARVADHAVIIPFTPVHDTDEQLMVTANKWDDPLLYYTWWTLSRGLYQRIFDDLDFDVEFTTSVAAVRQGEQLISVERPTIIARRRRRR